MLAEAREVRVEQLVKQGRKRTRSVDELGSTV